MYKEWCLKGLPLSAHLISFPIEKEMELMVLFCCCAKYNACGANGKKAAICDDSALAIA